MVAEAFALRRAANEARDVHEGQLRRNDLLRFRDRRQLVEARIRTATAPTFGSMVQNG
jgi:hypothetical protein